MSLKSKIEAVIYASEEPVTLPQLAGLLGQEAAAELDELAAMQAALPMEEPSIGEDAPSTTVAAPDQRAARERDRRVREHLRLAVDTLIREYRDSDRGIEIREVAGGFRMGTKPEYHDAVRGFVKSLKPALKLTLQALETLAVVAYKQPVTAAEIGEIRGVDSAGVLGGLAAGKLIATAGRKQVIGRPMLYKTTREFLVRFGLNDVGELPSMEEFERLAGELTEQEDLPMEPTDLVIERANARGDADHIRAVTELPATDAVEPVDPTMEEPVHDKAEESFASTPDAMTPGT